MLRFPHTRDGAAFGADEDEAFVALEALLSADEDEVLPARLGFG